jgi:anti-sigma regulatory factor (Ser/Thr protein kinase)/DNA-binding NarL/FixJ family response regulator
MSDGGRLRQIVFNLLSNAVKFTPSGRIGVEALATGDDGRTLEIRIADTGIGIPAAYLEEIFEPFRQVQGGMNRQYSGTGLGLAICRRLVEALGGTLRVESVEGEGSTFTIALPLELADRSAGAETAEREEESAGLAGAKLLIVDPNPKNLGVMSILLAPHAASIERALSLEEARGSVQDATHLLVSTAAGNIESLRAFMEAARSAGALVTLLHSNDGGASAADMMMLGADQLVIKPVGADDLLAALQSLYGDDPARFVAPSLLASAAA